MSDFFSIFFLVIALCADAFTASFVYGADHVKIPLLSASIITLLSTGILAAFLFAGNLLRPWLPENLAVWIGAALLAILGISKLFSAPTKTITQRANIQEPEILSPRESFFLGIALSIDSAAAGVGAGLTESSAAVLLGLTLLLGFLSIICGCRLGRLAASWTRLDFSKLSGFLLILLALLKLF